LSDNLLGATTEDLSDGAFVIKDFLQYLNGVLDISAPIGYTLFGSYRSQECNGEYSSSLPPSVFDAEEFLLSTSFSYFFVRALNNYSSEIGYIVPFQDQYANFTRFTGTSYGSGYIITPDGTRYTSDSYGAAVLRDLVRAMFATGNEYVYSGPRNKICSGQVISVEEQQREFSLGFALSTEIDVSTPSDIVSVENIHVFQRVEAQDFNHEFHVTSDLSSAQYADLASFAFKLGSYFQSLK
jgi:hypothetical protein